MGSINTLVVSKVQWCDTLASGNTYSNIFGKWENARFFSLYLREALPSNSVCSRYFSISDGDVARSVVNWGERCVGKEFSSDDVSAMRQDEALQSDAKREKRFVELLRSSNTVLFRVLQELLWKLGRWRSSKLDEFLGREPIDDIFCAAADPLYLQEVAQYCKRLTGAKLVLFFADDTYSHKTWAPLAYSYQSLLRRSIQSAVEESDLLYGASTKLCEEYGKYFNRHISPLYKGCSFKHTHVSTTVSTPLKMVYAGNLLYGRWRTLRAVAQEVEKVNAHGRQVELEIYTGTAASSEMLRALNVGGCCRIVGCRPYEEIRRILGAADIVVYVESFERGFVSSTRLSFSTKIIDCMESGKCLLAIGPACLASIEYLTETGAAVVVSDLRKIGDTIRNLAANPDHVLSLAARMNSYAKRVHDILSVRTRVRKDFDKLVGEGRDCRSS